VIRHGGPTGPAPLGWEDDRYDPGREPVAVFDETAWWGDCANTWHEEQKQMVAAQRMGLLADWNAGHPPTYRLGNRSVLDIGGGPVSLLLKCAERGRSEVVDPGRFPSWVTARYKHCGIRFTRMEAERFEREPFDEVWCYNVLQHVRDPALVIEVARRHAPVIRIFEWIDLPAYEGHPHMLTQEFLDQHLRGTGFTAKLDDQGSCGRAYYGVFHSASD
jgi:hypothetical protein